MSRLAVAIRQHVNQPNVTAVEIEQRAGVPKATISNILRDVHPRPERLGQLLKAVDDDTAMQWLEAYLLDDVPDEFRPRVSIYIKEIKEGGLRESAPDSAAMADFDLAWLRLRAVLVQDTEAGQWFCKTVALVLGAQPEQDTAPQEPGTVTYKIQVIEPDEPGAVNRRA